ncbi:MAG: PilN domain-containing protein [Solirubrobacterales bacterium]
MRPINLIPAEQRRGSARGPRGRSSFSGYIALGVLGAVVVCMLAVVMTSNQINSKTEELAEIQDESHSQRQVADALRPYGHFADLQRARMTQIDTLAAERFDWERPLRQLSKAIPLNVWVVNVAASVAPGIEVGGGGAGGDIATLREEAKSPAFTISGCTYSQHAVARMMIRMKNLDDVTDVHLAKSARKDSSEQGGGTAVTEAQPGQEQEDVQDCTGSARVTAFDILVVFGGATNTASAGGAAGVPPGAAAPIADANAAVAQGNEASSAAGGPTP